MNKEEMKDKALHEIFRQMEKSVLPEDFNDRDYEESLPGTKAERVAECCLGSFYIGIVVARGCLYICALFFF